MSKHGITKTYRWTFHDHTTLEQLVEKVSIAVGESVSHTEVLRGAIKVAAQAQPEEVYRAAVLMQQEEAELRAQAKLHKLEENKRGAKMTTRIEDVGYIGEIDESDLMTLDEEKGLYFCTSKAEYITVKWNHTVVVAWQ